MAPEKPTGELDTPAAEGPGDKPTFTPPPTSPGPEPTLAPVPRVTAQAAAIEVSSGVEQWRGLVSAVGFGNVDYVLNVLGCESRGNASAHNVNPATGDDSVGLLQINLHASLLPGRLALLQSLGYEAFDRDSAVAVLMDPEANLRAAYAMSGGGQSFAAWTCR